MYAIFEDGSRQYRVEVGTRVVIDYRLDTEKGARLELNKVLLTSNGDALEVGKPLVEGARVLAEVIDPDYSIKTTTQKFRRRKNSRRFNGHRQPYLELRVTHILGKGDATPEYTPKVKKEPVGETAATPEANS